LSLKVIFLLTLEETKYDDIICEWALIYY
jgi:hypothetical protein